MYDLKTFDVHSMMVTSTSSGQLLFTTPTHSKGILLDVDVDNQGDSGVNIAIQDTFTTYTPSVVKNSAQTFIVNRVVAPASSGQAISLDQNSLVGAETLGIVSAVDLNGNDMSGCLITVKYGIR